MSELRRRRLGDSDIEVTAVGLGCNNFGGRLDAVATAGVVDAALEEGINFLDTADIYGDGRSEELVGRAVAARRQEVVLATKFGGGTGGRPGGARDYVLAAAEASLRRLGTDHIDLYQHHFPDEQTPIEETLGALDELVRAGKVRAIGSSNYSAEQIEAADRISRENGWARFVTAQNQYSLLDRRQVEATITPVCERLGIAIIPYFPLASGLLSGKYRRGQPAPSGSRLAGNPGRAGELMTDANFDIIERLEELASRRGLQLIDVAIGGLAALPAVVSVIAGATTAEQVRANAGGGLWTPTAEDLAELDRITARQPVG